MDISFFLRQAYQPAARFRPDRLAIGLDNDRAITLDEIAKRSNAYSHVLTSLGVAKGDRVAVLMYNEYEYWLAYFAITRIGAIAVRLNFRLKTQELEYAITDSGTMIVLGHSELLARLAKRAGQLGVRHYVQFDGTAPALPGALPWSTLEEGPTAEPDLPLPAANDGAMIMYTSGTTGLPKGALWTHGSTTWWVAQQIMEWGYNESSVTMVTGPLYHIAGLENYSLPTLAAGGRVVMLRSKNFAIVRALQIASEQKVTDLLLFPMMIQCHLAYFDHAASCRFTGLASLMVGGAWWRVPWSPGFLTR